MKRNIRYAVTVLYLMFFLVGNMLAQDKLGILQLSDNPYSSYFNLGIDVEKDLLEEGAEDEATLEFWVKSTKSGNKWRITDLSKNSEGLDLRMYEDSKLQLGENDPVHVGNVMSGIWHHVAIVWNDGKMNVFVNANIVGAGYEYSPNRGTSTIHFYKEANSEFLITEVRGWSRAKSQEEISDNQWRSFVFNSQYELKDLREQDGLEILFGSNDQETINNETLGFIQQLWQSIYSSTNGLKEVEAKGIARSMISGDLLTISDEISHPVLSNQNIDLKASQGGFSAGVEDKTTDMVRLKWRHIEGADGYNIYKNRSLIETRPDVNTLVSSDLEHIDKDVLPGEIYTYRVEGYSNDDNLFRPDAIAGGFIFPNGSVSGNVQTESKVFVEGVKVTATPLDGAIAGSALSFAADDSPIDVERISNEFLGDGGSSSIESFTLEFWYQSGSSLVNEVIKMANVSVSVSSNSINASVEGERENGWNLVADQLTEDDQWHHIAVVFSNESNKIYHDGQLVANNESNFMPNYNSFNVLRINAQANSNYHLDELRVWSGARSSQDIGANYQHIISGEEDNLLLYYRFDMMDNVHIYNQAIETIGSYAGISQTLLTRLSSEEQPDIVYGTYTDNGGNYNIGAINAGGSTKGATFHVTLSKPNHTFNPSFTEKEIRRSSERADYAKTADFIDVSSLPLAGKVLYEMDGDIYPALQGIGFTIDGASIQGSDENLVTDNAGAFSIGAPLGKHQIAVSNPLQELHLATQSLSFDGADDFAIMESVFDFERDGVWSGWLKKLENSDVSQVLLSIGDIAVALESNKLVLKNDDLNLISLPTIVDSEWNFFALAFEDSTQKLRLYFNDVYEEEILSDGISLNTQIMLGARGLTSARDFYEGNLCLVEYRNRYLDESAIENVRIGEFIEGDSLLISYSFNENNSETTRTNSLTNNSQDYVMTLNGPTIDVENVHTYTRKFKYKYKAEYAAQDFFVDAEDDSQFDFNVVQPVTDLRFYNESRFGFVGNLVLPCGFGLGEWDVAVKRTDILSPEFIRTYAGSEADDLFNDDQTVFSIPNLMPGKYKVRITNRQDESIQLETPIFDLTLGWNSYDFEYRSPMSLQIGVFAQIDSIEQVITDGTAVLRASFEDYTPACEDLLVFEQGKGYLASIEVYEEYNENKCYVEDVSYKFDGDMASLVASTEGTGNDSIVFKTLNPNFTGDFLRSFSITAASNGRNKTEVITGVVTGNQQFNRDFTLEAPPRILAVVHDPVGDGSSATLSKGVTFSFSESVTNSGGVDLLLDFSTSFGTNTYGGVWSGFGGGFVYLKQFESTKTKTLFNVSESFRFGNTNSKSSSVTLNQSISTSSSGTVPGVASDVYVGYTPIIHIGKGSSLEVENCQPVLRENVEIAKPDRSPLFSITHQHIKDVIIPNLEHLKLEVSDDQSYYEEQITGWNEVLAANEALVGRAETLSRFEVDNPNPYVVVDSVMGQDVNGTDVYFVEEKVYFPESIAFSAGQNLSYSLTDKSSGSFSDTKSSDTQGEKTFSTSFNFFGSEVNVASTVKGVYSYNSSEEDGEENESTYSFNLTDDDIGDQFDILVKKDDNHVYATPIFKTLAGRSMCPYEIGTQSREGVEITMKSGESNFGEGDLDDRIAYNIVLKNTQVASESVGTGYYKTYNVKAYNRKGAIVRLNGSLLGESGTTVVLEPEGEESIKDAVISIARNPDSPELVDFEDISIVMYSPCEEGGGSLGFFDADTAGVELADTLWLSAHFHRPCLEEIEILSPQPHWVVNGSSDNSLPFEFQIKNPEESFDQLIVEYANPQSNEGEVLEIIDYSDLQETAVEIGGNMVYSFNQNVSGLPDGSYNFRLVPKCGTGNEAWRTRTATDWIGGSIYRLSPIITEVTPAENTILREGLITASYDRPISPNGVNSLNISLRGILGGKEYEPVSVKFGEGTDKIEVPNQQILSLNSAYTVELWFNILSTPSTTVNVLSKGDNYSLSLNSDGHIGNSRIVSNNPIALGEWVHVAIVYDGNTNIKTYFDGEVVAELNNAISFPTNDDPLIIGGDGFRGLVDEVRIWNVVKTNAELITYQEERLTGNESGLRAYYVLDNIALEGEAIRDYTGNTSGTFGEGFTWVTGTDAAPISVDKVVQDVPIDVILSGERQVIINPKSNFPAYFLEGAQLTAFITDQSIEDVYGNKAPGKSWHFVIDRNAVRWSKNNYSMFQNEGSGQEFFLEISNEGATHATYELIDLPDWLQVIGKKEGIQYELPYGFTNAMTFKTADWMSPGIYGSHIKAVTYGVDGARTGLESFYLEVEVVCPAPDYSFDSDQYAEQMLILAELSVDGEISYDENDVIAAYIGEQVRGFASPVVSEESSLIQMVVFGASETASLDFRVWDASSCKEYRGIIESYSYEAGSTIGSYSNPMSFTVSSIEIQQIELAQGYNWISFNQQDLGQSTLSLSAITGLSIGDVIKARSGESAIYQGANSWSGLLTSIDPKQSYLIESNEFKVISITGELVDIDTNIPIISGINWVGYLPSVNMDIERAFVSIEGGANLTVIGKGEYAEYSSEGWAGSLTSLSPGSGYRIIATQGDVLNYTGSAGVAETTAIVDEPMEMSERIVELGWSQDYAQSSDQMYITSELVGEAIDASRSYIIGAFSSGELKGVAIPQKIDHEYRYFMVIHGDSEMADSLEFMIGDEHGNVKKLSNKLAFVQNRTVGNYKEPYQLNLLGELVNDYMLSQNYPNPVVDETMIRYSLSESGSTRLVVYDLSGRTVKTLVDKIQEKGNYEINLNVKADLSIGRGVYFYELTNQDKRIVKKMIVK